MKFKPKDVIALAVIVGYFIARGLNIEIMFSAGMLLILGYYFARRDEPDHSGEEKK